MDFYGNRKMEYYGTYKMNNGTFFKVYKNGNKMFDQNGIEITEEELKNYSKLD